MLATFGRWLSPNPATNGVIRTNLTSGPDQTNRCVKTHLKVWRGREKKAAYWLEPGQPEDGGTRVLFGDKQAGGLESVQESE